MPIEFNDGALSQLETEFAGFSLGRQAEIDALAAQVFVQLHMVGLAHGDLPSTVLELKRKEIAKLRLLASTLEAVFGMMANYSK